MIESMGTVYTNQGYKSPKCHCYAMNIDYDERKGGGGESEIFKR